MKKRAWPTQLKKYEKMAEESLILVSAAETIAAPYKKGFPKPDPEDGGVLMPSTWITWDIGWWLLAAEDCYPGTWDKLVEQVERHLARKKAA